MQSGHEVAYTMTELMTQSRATRLLTMIAEQLIDIPQDEMTTAEKNIFNGLWAANVVTELPLTTKEN